MSEGNLFHAFDLSASGLSAQRARLNVVSANLANAQTTRTPGGGPYRRQVLSVESGGGPPGLSLFERMLHSQRAISLDPSRTSARHLEEPGPVRFPGGREAVVWTVGEDGAPGRLVYEPGHPDANAEGYVEYPNVEVIREMVDLMAASRAYEANITVLNATKSMLRKALEI
jgi:flagellar basal-body rod protein FlgC